MSLFDPSGGGRRRQPIGKTFLVRVSKGQTVVSAWPAPKNRAWKKQNKPRSTFFKNVQEAFKYLPPWERETYREMAKEGPFLPRDFWTMNAYGRFLALEEEDGPVTVPERALFDISQSLDVCGQSVGGLLIRQGKYWINTPPGAAGLVLTSTGEDTPPEWLAGGGGGGDPYLEPPNIGMFTQVGDLPSSAVLANNARSGIILSRLGVTDTNVLLTSEIGEGETTAETLISEVHTSPENTSAGVGIYDSSTGRGAVMAWLRTSQGSSQQMRASWYADLPGDTWGGSIKAEGFLPTDNPMLRIRNDGEKIVFEYGLAPEAWAQWATWTDSALVTGADTFCLYSYLENAATEPSQQWFKHWRQY